jgi:glutamate-1-semialdehyde 2,1-aminomutase
MLDTRLEEAGVPLRVTGLSTVWTVLYTQPSRYHWMFQFYLRDQGLSLSWVGSGRLIFSLDIDDTLFEAVCTRFVQAALRMRADGWWDGPARSTREIRGRVLREMLRRMFGRPPAVA